MKKLLAVLFALTLIFSLCTICASAEEFVTVELNGAQMDFDVPAQIINDRTLVPLRGIFETLGATVEWDDATQTVTAYRDDTSISLQIGSKSLYVNRVLKEIDVPAQLVNDRTLVPARAVAESFGANVDWDEANQTVIITDENTPDFKSLFDKAMNSDDYSSLAAKVTAHMDATADGEAINMDMDMSLKATQDPLAMAMEYAVDVAEEKISAQMYMVEEDGKVVMYAVAEEDGEKMVVKQEIPMPDNTSLISAPQIEDSAIFKVSKQEIIDGVNTVKYVYTITGDDLNAALKTVDVGGAFGSAGITTDMFGPDAYAKVYMWIDGESGALYKYSMDMTSIMNDVYKSMGMGSSMKVDAFVIDMEITALSDIEPITVPDDIKKIAVDASDLY